MGRTSDFSMLNATSIHLLSPRLQPRLGVLEGTAVLPDARWGVDPAVAADVGRWVGRSGMTGGQ
jgi:hypothetical protein